MLRTTSLISASAKYVRKATTQVPINSSFITIKYRPKVYKSVKNDPGRFETASTNGHVPNANAQTSQYRVHVKYASAINDFLRFNFHDTEDGDATLFNAAWAEPRVSVDVDSAGTAST